MNSEQLAATADANTALEWRERALCAQVDTELFFPEKGGSTKEAKAVCSRCDVRPECAAYALDRNERYGIWGGLSEVDRRRLRRQPKAAAVRASSVVSGTGATGQRSTGTPTSAAAPSSTPDAA